MEHPLSPQAKVLLDAFTVDFPAAGKTMANIPEFRKLLNESVEDNPDITYGGYTEIHRPDQKSNPVTVPSNPQTKTPPTIFIPKDPDWTGRGNIPEQKAITHFAFELQNARRDGELHALHNDYNNEVYKLVFPPARQLGQSPDQNQLRILKANFVQELGKFETVNSYTVAATVLASGIPIADPHPLATTQNYVDGYIEYTQSQNKNETLRERIKKNLKDPYGKKDEGPTRRQRFEGQFDDIVQHYEKEYQKSYGNQSLETIKDVNRLFLKANETYGENNPSLLEARQIYVSGAISPDDMRDALQDLVQEPSVTQQYSRQGVELTV